MARVLEPWLPGADFEDLARVYYEAKLEERMALWWSLHGRRWPVAIEVEGRGHLDAALQAGRGAVLWGMEFCNVMTRKCVLRQSGVPLVHLRGSMHGAPEPPTRFGLRTVARLQRSAEDIYLVACEMVGPSAPPGGLNRLGPHLDANRCVHINGEAEVGRIKLPVRVLGLERGLPSGAPAFALKTGAPLVPIHLERLGSRSYRLVVHEPIAQAPRVDDRSWIAEAVQRFVSLIEDAVLRHPADWNWDAGWLLTALGEVSPAAGIDLSAPPR
jgi:lauroyl/myristoyl acyltransferase